MSEVDCVECLAGRGLAGDRFLDYRLNYWGQITFFTQENYDRLCRELNVHDKSPAAFRRNVITSGIDLNALIGQEFEIQGVRFLGRQECTPCYWMDRAFAPGAEKLLRNEGGLRATILTNGILHVMR